MLFRLWITKSDKVLKSKTLRKCQRQFLRNSQSYSSLLVDLPAETIPQESFLIGEQVPPHLNTKKLWRDAKKSNPRVALSLPPTSVIPRPGVVRNLSNQFHASVRLLDLKKRRIREAPGSMVNITAVDLEGEAIEIFDRLPLSDQICFDYRVNILFGATEIPERTASDTYTKEEFNRIHNLLLPDTRVTGKGTDGEYRYVTRFAPNCYYYWRYEYLDYGTVAVITFILRDVK